MPKEYQRNKITAMQTQTYPSVSTSISFFSYKDRLEGETYRKLFYFFTKNNLNRGPFWHVWQAVAFLPTTCE